MTGVLADTRILVTRPRGQAQTLLAALREAGADVLHRPTLEIIPLTPAGPAFATPPQWCVFISPNAVDQGLPHLPQDWHEHARMAAVGPGTAAALAAHGLAAAVAPRQGGGADDLLAEADFSPQPHERVLLIRGEGGRQRLQQALRARHVEVAEWAVYRRQRPVGVLDIPPDWLHSRLAFTIVTSVAGLENLLGMAGPGALEWLLKSRLITVSDRVARVAQDAGFDRPVVAAGADAQALTDAVIASRQEQT